MSVLLAAIYVAGGLVIARYYGGYANAVTARLLGWFLLFLVMAILMFGSVFIAIGAACSDLKDSQGMMTPGHDAPDGADVSRGTRCSARPTARCRHCCRSFRPRRRS